MTLPTRSQAGAQLPQGCPVSLWGELSKGIGRGQGEDGENTAAPSTEQAGKGGRNTCSQEPEVGWGSRGFVSSVSSEPMLNGIPRCPAVSHPAVLSAS